MSAASALPDAPFDRVIVDDAGGRRELSPDEFFALPLSVRIRCVLERRASFFLGHVEVDRREALDSLRRARAVG